MNCKIHLAIFLTVLGLFFSQTLLSQELGYIQQDIIKTAGVTTDAQINSLPINQIETTRQYIDGLGRPIQTIAVQGSANLNKDIIQIIAYNNLGQKAINYLPYVDNNASNANSSYRSTAITDQSNYYNTNGTTANPNKVANDNSPWNQQVFENSPLQRVLQSGMTGNGFQPGQHYKSVNYRSNSSADNVIKWGLDGSYQNNYAVNTLAVTDETDEDGQEIQLFKDMNGHIILKRQISNAGNLDTYYVYNAAGIISYVVPPLALVKSISNGYNLTSPTVSPLLFHYIYDNMGRVVQKIVPGAVSTYIIYDPYNRPVLLQDGNLRNLHQWNYIKYDAEGRAISQGIYTDATPAHTTLAGMQAYVSSLVYSNWYESRKSITPYYTNSVFPTTNNDGTALEDLSYSYYDDYDLNQDGTADYNYISAGITGESTATALTRSMPTMLRTRTLSVASPILWLLKVQFYDKNNHLIQKNSNNVLNNTTDVLTDTNTSTFDFTGNLLVSKVVKVTGSGATNTNSIETSYTYDNRNRATAIDQQYNNGTNIRVAAYEYNELGQMVKKDLQLNTSNSLPANVTLDGTNSVTPGGQLTVVATNSIILSPGFTAASGSTFSATVETNYLQAIDYRYNIRGQLLSMNNSKLANDNNVTNSDSNDLFGMQLLYDQKDANIGNTAYFNGKVSGVSWMSKDANGTSSYERSYKYTYDNFNHYTGAAYAERAPTSTTAFNSNIGGFDESGITYDENGNIKTLNRNASTVGSNSIMQIDNLVYNYNTSNPNQLINISDGSDANHTGAGFRNLTGLNNNYTYDNNSGNLTIDPYKPMAFNYNELNKPSAISVYTNFNTANVNVGLATFYDYDATGIVIKKRTDNFSTGASTSTNYIDGFVYVNGVLSHASMPEGRVINVGGVLKPEYIINDQQGNARLSFQDNGSGVAVVKQENSYYGFGLIMPNSPVPLPSTPNTQLYNGGSEWQNDYGNLPDYYQTYYRNYDPSIGRWISPDPKAESSESLSGYHYAGNNPIMMNDPMGDIFSSWAEVNEAIANITSNGGGSGSATGPGADEFSNFSSGIEEFGLTAGEMSFDHTWGISPQSAKSYQEAAARFNAAMGKQVIDPNIDPYALNEVSVISGNYQSYLNADADIQKQISAHNTGLGSDNQEINNISDIPESLSKAADAIGLAADFHSVPFTAVKLITEDGSKALKMLTRSGTVVGAVAGGVPAGYNIIKDWHNGGIRSTHAKDWVNLGLAAGGVTVEFFGVGETWDLIGAGITGATAIVDIHSAFSDK
ncbi:DUF6443 domain-containing protein [Pedobacter sp. L105]|uniref:DUF6443 domain-containing protein n=1 Tax=Pedobacter sp. L105 TaxID=1641871 RepID=UPI00131E18F3|nr:DUF6443 domain-containing protein [Pedobacter sp. L105]